jgi:hypothetical protein
MLSSNAWGVDEGAHTKTWERHLLLAKFRY